VQPVKNLHKKWEGKEQMLSLKRVNQPHCRKQADIGKRKAIRERIRRTEDAIARAKAYLDCGEHAHWHGFRPMFVDKVQNGELCPPHKDWVRNVFLPRCKRALRDAERVLKRMARRTACK
jgi:hypothetical protein